MGACLFVVARSLLQCVQEEPEEAGGERTLFAADQIGWNLIRSDYRARESSCAPHICSYESDRTEIRESEGSCWLKIVICRPNHHNHRSVVKLCLYIYIYIYFVENKKIKKKRIIGGSVDEQLEGNILFFSIFNENINGNRGWLWLTKLVRYRFVKKFFR